MVKPIAFDANEQAIKSNFFSKQVELPPRITQDKALLEFNNLKDTLKDNGIKVMVIDEDLTSNTPDAIFSSNWISFHEHGLVGVYPMESLNRRLERREDVFDFVEKELGNVITDVIDYTDAELDGVYLEGTGSVVLDRINKIAYCSSSTRSNEDLFIEFCEDFDYDPVFFNATQTVDGKLKPIFHTNLMMSVCTKFVIICLDVVKDKKEKKNILQHIKKSGKEAVFISESQMNSFVANSLELEGNNGSVLMMSLNAASSLDKNQLSKLEQFVKILKVDLSTIEKVGGGSTGSIITEIFW